jgi:hypothetical protein
MQVLIICSYLLHQLIIISLYHEHKNKNYVSNYSIIIKLACADDYR